MFFVTFGCSKFRVICNQFRSKGAVDGQLDAPIFSVCPPLSSAYDSVVLGSAREEIDIAPASELSGSSAARGAADAYNEASLLQFLEY
jgi:hypothetical protein